MKYLEKNLRNYVEKCFKDAYISEGRTYDESDWSFEWVMIKNPLGIYQLYPIAFCKYKRVLNKVLRRLKRNLKKNFSIEFKSTSALNGHLVNYQEGTIDYNYTKALFKVDKKFYALNLLNDIDDYDDSKPIPANTYRKLVYKYWNLNDEKYLALPLDSEKRSLPSISWDMFKELYKVTFNTSLMSYDIVCSSGVERL